MPFEEALQKLESVVEAMESGELPLESLIARYEEGVKLAKVCQEKLAEAELKIQQLEKTAAGELKLQPLTAEPRQCRFYDARQSEPPPGNSLPADMIDQSEG